MKKIFSLAMLIIGTIIGAGFASGKEISAFFGKNISIVVAPLVGIGTFLLCYLFCTIGRIFKQTDFGAVNAKLLGKLRFVADIFLLLNSLIVLSGMLSGMDSLLNPIFPISPAYSIISGILCALIVSNGIKGLLKSNCVIVPFIIFFIVLICCFNISATINLKFDPFTLPSVIVYVSMNVMLACTVLTTINEKPKTVFWASLIAAIAITIIMLFIILTLNSQNTNSDMPLITAALSTNKFLYYAAVAVVATSIFTTMLTAFSGLSSWLTPILGKKLAIIVSLIAGLIVSNLGFENVVAYLYPIIGIFGITYILLCVFFLTKGSTTLKKLFDKRNRKVHNSSQKTQYHGGRHH